MIPVWETRPVVPHPAPARAGLGDRLAPYWAVLRIRFQMLLQYRAAAVAGFGTQLFFGLVLVNVYRAFYHTGHIAPRQAPMALPQVVTYVWLGQALLGTLPWNTDNEINALIRNGGVAYELLRPMDLYAFWYSRCVALRTAPTVLRAVPMMLLALLLLDMQPPASFASFAAFVVAMSGAIMLGCAITMLLNISMLWTVSGEGITMLVVTAVGFLSGLYIPLPLLPGWSQGVLSVLPFRGLIDLPFRLYLGHVSAGTVWGILAFQAAWTVGLVALGRLVLSRGLRRVVVQGG